MAKTTKTPPASDPKSSGSDKPAPTQSGTKANTVETLFPNINPSDFRIHIVERGNEVQISHLETGDCHTIAKSDPVVSQLRQMTRDLRSKQAAAKTEESSKADTQKPNG